MHLDRPLDATKMVTSSVPAPAPPSRYGGRERPRLIARFGSSMLSSRPHLRAAHEAAKHSCPPASIRLHRQRGAGERAPAVTPRAAAPCDRHARALTPPAKSSTRVPWGQHSSRRQQQLPGRLPSIYPDERLTRRVERADRSTPKAAALPASAPTARDGEFARGEVRHLVEDGQGEPFSSPRSPPPAPLLKKARVKKRALLRAAERHACETAAAAERDRRDELALLDAQRLVEVETKAPTAPSSQPPHSAPCLLPCAW